MGSLQHTLPCLQTNLIFTCSTGSCKVVFTPGYRLFRNGMGDSKLPDKHICTCMEYSSQCLNFLCNVLI